MELLNLNLDCKNVSKIDEYNIDGDFIPGEILVGQESGANYSVKTIYTDNLADGNDPTNIKDKYADNRQIEIEGDQILDFSEINPFGMP